MSYAVCISCGSAKRRAFATCKHCGYWPTGDNVAMAKSLMLSTEWVTDDGQPQASQDQLRHVQAHMANGESPTFDPDELARLVSEKEAWDRTADVSWLRVILLALAVLSIPAALFAIDWWIRHLR